MSTNNIVEAVAEIGSECCRECAALRAALAELVALKDLKDRLQQLHEMGHGTDYDIYQRRQPIAWAVARSVLSRPLVFADQLAFARAVLARSALAATTQASSDEEVMDMALRESAKCVLREGQVYRFRKVGDCETCAAMSAASLEAYGPANERRETADPSAQPFPKTD